MSQDSSNHQIDSDLSDVVLAKHCLVETDTCKLVDEIFLEQSLNQITPLLSDPKPAIRDVLPPVYQPDTVILVFRTLVQSLRVVPYRQRASYVARLASETTYQSDLFIPQPGNSRFFLCLACASVTMTLLLWAGSQVRLGANNAAPPGLVVPQTTPQESTPTVSTAGVQPTVDKPVQSVNPEKLPQPIEPTAGVKPTTPSTAATQLAKVPLPARPQVPANTVIPVPARVKPERIYVPYQPPAQAVVSKPAKPQVAYKASIPSATVPSVSPSGASISTHTLVGVLEFGDRSAALVNINRVTRRISVGETLTPGGWKLTKVAGQTVVLQRGSKLRSIYVGQTF